MKTKPRYRCVATLGEALSSTTCSILEAKHQHYPIIEPVSSFNEAIAMVKDDRADAALIPGAFPGIGAFFMDPDLRLVRSFAAEIPALVLAAKQQGCSSWSKIHAHPATKPFWRDLPAPVVEAGSNDEAAAAVRNHHEACVTNAAAARRFGLQVLQILRPRSPMSWNLFVKADGPFWKTPGNLSVSGTGSRTSAALSNLQTNSNHLNFV